ncbi:Fermitin family 2 [Thelohanellus kitauei]|uniref:Fermitin family 2 n=1 Tax=Thelohanellus kitauei TaxID=669202 RepID=A0A0C2J422_THEKT|nr:Fermitin family 2 [Thelohanellus kitauei]
MVYVVLPNFRVIHHLVNTCGTVLDVIKSVCEAVGIRKFEELSFVIIPGQDDSAVKESKKKSVTAERHEYYDQIEQYYESVEKNRKDPICDLDIMIPEFIWKILPKSNALSSWCAFHANWVFSSMSLKAQNFRDFDILYLRHKYVQFTDVNPKIDLIRFNFVYAHVVRSIQIQETKCNESELYDMLTLIWNVHLIREKLITEELEMEKSTDNIDDVDQALKQLELSSKGDVLGTQNTDEQVIFLKSILPHEGAKNCQLTKLVKSWLTIYKGNTETEKSLVENTQIVGAIVNPKMDLNKNSYQLKLTNLFNKKGKEIKISLSFSEENDFLDWFAHLRCSTRGTGLTNVGIQRERVFLSSYLDMKKRLLAKDPKTVSISYGIENICPEWILKGPNCSPDQVLNQLLDHFAPVCMLSKNESQLNLIQKWKSLNFAGMILYMGVFKPTFDVTNLPKKIKHDLFGVSSSFIARINASSEEIVEQWPFTTLKHWTLNWKTNVMTMNIGNANMNLLILECPIKKVHECLGGNIYHNNKKDPSEPFDFPMFTKLTS